MVTMASCLPTILAWVMARGNNKKKKRRTGRLPLLRFRPELQVIWLARHSLPETFLQNQAAQLHRAPRPRWQM